MKKNLSVNVLKSIIDNIGISVNVFDRKGRRVYVNPYFYHLSGLPKNAKISPDMTTGENEKKGKYLTKKLMDCMRLDKTFEIHNFYHKSHSTNTQRYFDFIIGPLKNENGTVIGAYTTVKDVTSRYLAKRELVKLNASLEDLVKERTKKLVKANTELKRMSKERSFLVSDIAHEIKTILTIISGNIEMLELGDNMKEPLQAECGKEIKEQIAKMNNIVSDLVYIIKSREYDQLLKLEKINVIRLLDDLVKKYKKLTAGNFKIRFANEIDVRSEQWIMADESKLNTLFSNLIENAMKFSGKKGKLEISLQNGRDMLALSFKDNGIGIKKSELKDIFNPFFQTDKSRSGYNENHSGKLKKGFGLGLAICKRIAEAHKGKIIAKSGGLGTGTTFEVLLPINRSKQK